MQKVHNYAEKREQSKEDELIVGNWIASRPDTIWVRNVTEDPEYWPREIDFVRYTIRQPKHGVSYEVKCCDVIHSTGTEGIDLIPAHLDLKITDEIDLEVRGLEYDTILIDTPADTGSPAAISGMISADYVLAPVQPESFGVQGIPWVQQAVSWAVTSHNHDLRLLGYFLNKRERLAIHAVHEQIARNVHGVMVFETVVRQRVAHGEAMLAGQGVTEYAPDSPAAEEIRALATEIVERIESTEERRIAA